jgi:predicted metal-dependent hydrolase
MGRPLPYGSRGVDPVAEDVVLSPDEALRQAQRLIDDGYPFYAHEVFESMWKSTAGTHRQLWKALAQLAVGLTHLQRGNVKGAVALLRRAADRIDPYSAEAPHRLDIAGLASHARRLAAGEVADLRPRLRRGS